ncbi:MAG: hypothetical protein LC802_13720 [Acidobacteria bacterium]|nr:hypothetical protein [Acidobacteriota bacterium]
MHPSIRPCLRQSALSVAAFTFLVCGAALCAAQSGDISYPAPVFSEEVAGRIAPRDIGDARRTRHFYIFRGTEGDLIVNVESEELSGDVDVFTSPTLRPLLKVTLYGGTATKVSKSVFLRKDETLILRVEARAAGDAEGTYRIRFGGSFAPAPAGLAPAPETVAPDTASSTRKDRNVRRVTSTGARINEPVIDVPSLEAADAAPTPTPGAASGERAEGSAPPRREAPRSSRRGRGTRPAPARSKAPNAEKSPAETASGTTSSEGTSAAATPSTEAARAPEATARPSGTRTPRTPRRRPSPRRRAPAERAETTTPAESSTPTEGGTPAPAAAAASQRLIIVTKDGETLEREMSTVRRVTVENNQVVVVTKDGKTIRQPMANVLKMSIEP